MVRIFAPTKACWNVFAFYYDSDCPCAEECFSLFLSSSGTLFIYLMLNAAKFSILFGRHNRQPQAWWSPEVEKAVSKRPKAFAAANTNDEDCQAYISAFQHVSSVTAKAKAEACLARCSSLFFSPKSEPKSVYSLLRSFAGSSPSSSSFPNCSSPK